MLIGGRDHLSDSDAARSLTVREALRQLIALEGGNAPPLSGRAHKRLNQAIAQASWALQCTDDGPRLVPAAAGPLDRALGILLAITTSAMLDESWSRLKTCPGHHCGWVFYDRSRNNSGRWCSMTVCGGREKSRAHYRRHRTRGD
jgi:predicted RNA-binding Zn ribbon-like protein